MEISENLSPNLVIEKWKKNYECVREKGKKYRKNEIILLNRKYSVNLVTKISADDSNPQFIDFVVQFSHPRVAFFCELFLRITQSTWNDHKMPLSKEVNSTIEIKYR